MKLKQYEGKELEEVGNEEDRNILEIIRRIDEEYGLGQSLKNALQIEDWCERKYGDKKIWDRKLPSSISMNEEEKKLGIYLASLRMKLKQYEGKELEEVENEEDRDILEIIRRLDKEYGLDRSLKNALKIEDWCKRNYGDKDILDRKLPSSISINEEEKKLGQALNALRTKLKQYEGKELEEVENEEERRILEIVRRLDEEYNPKKSKQQDLLQAKQQRDEARTRNSQAKDLEGQVSGKLKKRGKNHEEQ